MTRNLMNYDDHNDKAGLQWSGKSQGSLDFIQVQEVVKSLFKVSEKSGNFITQSGFRKYPYPHHGGNWKFRREGRVVVSKNEEIPGGLYDQFSF